MQRCLYTCTILVDRCHYTRVCLQFLWLHYYNTLWHLNVLNHDNIKMIIIPKIHLTGYNSKWQLSKTVSASYKTVSACHKTVSANCFSKITLPKSLFIMQLCSTIHLYSAHFLSKLSGTTEPGKRQRSIMLQSYVAKLHNVRIIIAQTS